MNRLQRSIKLIAATAAAAAAADTSLTAYSFGNLAICDQFDDQ